MSQFTYPALGHWQAFETFCADFFTIYFDAQAMPYGRSGQSQFGIDILLTLKDGSWYGIQCKQKADGKPLTRAEMEKELEATNKLPVAITHYVFATTAQRDRNVQDLAIELAEDVDFSVSVMAWDDFCDALPSEAYRQTVTKHFPNLAMAPVVLDASPEQALAAFRHRHWAELLPLPSLAQARGQRQSELLLTDIYTALDVTATVTVRSVSEQGEESRIEKAITLPGDQTSLDMLMDCAASVLDMGRATSMPDGHMSSHERRCRALEAAAANRRVVLVGAAGSGKSTFGRFLVACLLGESLGRPEAGLKILQGESDQYLPWSHGAPLSFFISLQAFQASDCFPSAQDSNPGDEHDAAHLVRYLCSLGPEQHRGAFARGLEQALARDHGVLVILDGLDETPSAERGRVRLRRVIGAFARAYPGCRMVVTSRPYAYKTGSPWRLDDAQFETVDLAPFSQAQQQTFVQAWYRRLVARGLLQVDETRRDEMVTDLIRQIVGRSYLSPLAKSPLMLTMMADLHASNSGSLPAGGRAALYAESLELLLDRWNETREGKKPTEMLGMPLEQIQRALEKLAFDVHRRRGLADGGDTPKIERSELWEALISTREACDHEGRVDDKEIMDYLHQRSGILVGESEKFYRFPHRSYQEYLAAAYLVQEQSFPELLGEVVAEDPSLWREVVQLAVGQVSKHPYMAWAVLELLVDDQPPADVSPDDGRFLAALLAGLSVRECRLHRGLSGVHAKKLEKIRLWLRRIVELGVLDVKDRVQAGQILGLLGDDRPGVGLGEDGLPSFEWVEIPAGSFIMGSENYPRERPVHEEKLGAFRMARYPVTVAQYQCFVDDGGYKDLWRECWTDAGWDWKGKREGPKPSDKLFSMPNHPRINTSWHESEAYARWLSEKTGRQHRLPTEAEWERSVRGEDGREYPWGPDFDSSRCHTRETGIGTTSAVGLFPTGEGPKGSNGSGVMDGSGNVWEWCSTHWESDYEQPVDDCLEGSTVRVLRGGSVAGSHLDARCAYRNEYDPDYVGWYIGLRLVAPI